MTTAVVVTTIVTDKASEETFQEQIFEQIRKNEQDLQAKLTHLDQEAQVRSAVFNVADFMTYAHAWAYLRKQESFRQVGVNGKTKPARQTTEMSEADFMDHVLDQVQGGQQPLYAQLAAEDLAALEDEQIGSHFSAQPFLY